MPQETGVQSKANLGTRPNINLPLARREHIREGALEDSEPQIILLGTAGEP